MTGLDRIAVTTVGRPPARRRQWWLITISLLTLFTPLCLLLPAFRNSLRRGLGEHLVVSDPLQHADLIYVLAGDFWGSRVLLGARLGAQGWAPKVIMTGGRYMDRYESDMAVDYAVEHGYPRDLFLPIKLNARSTIDEALAMRPIFHQLGAKRIILVTSNFHSRRSEQVFRLFLPEFEFLAEGSADDTFHPQAWWEKPQSRHLFFSEYEKIAGTFLVKFHLASADWLRHNQP